MKQIALNIQNGKEEVEITFPCTEKDLNKALEVVGIKERLAPKGVITEVLTPKGLSMLEYQEVNLDEINYLANLMDTNDASDIKTFLAAAEVNSYRTPKDLINLHFNLDRYMLIEDKTDFKAIGRRYMLTMHPAQKTEKGEPDYEGIGKEVMSSKHREKTQYGLLITNEDCNPQEVYDGQVFPFFSFTNKELLIVEAEYGGKKEYLYLPAPKITIQKALGRLGTENPEECKYEMIEFYEDSEKWENLFEHLLQEQNIYDVNAVAEKIDDGEWGFTKLSALMKYVEDDSLETLVKLAKKYDDFEFLEGAQDLDEVGRYALFMSFGCDVADELEDYINFEGIGKHMQDRYGGKFIDVGFVYKVGNKTLEEMLGDRVMEQKMQ